MGRHTYSDICEHVAQLGEAITFVTKKMDRYAHKCQILTDIAFRHIEGTQWAGVWEGADIGKNRTELMAHASFVLVEDGKCYGVHFINQHEHSNAGGEDWACVGMTPIDFKLLQKDEKDPEFREEFPDLRLDNVKFAGGHRSVTRFLRDFGLKAKIEKRCAVHQTV